MTEKSIFYRHRKSFKENIEIILILEGGHITVRPQFKNLVTIGTYGGIHFLKDHDFHGLVGP